MKYNLEGTIIHIHYERTDKIWQDNLDNIRINPDLEQPILEELTKLYEDAGPERLDGANEVDAIGQIPDRIPRSDRGAPIDPFKYGTITVWYEPEPTVNFEGKGYKFKNNGSSKIKLLNAYLNNEDMIEDFSMDRLYSTENAQSNSNGLLKTILNYVRKFVQ